ARQGAAPTDLAAVRGQGLEAPARAAVLGPDRARRDGPVLGLRRRRQADQEPAPVAVTTASRPADAGHDRLPEGDRERDALNAFSGRDPARRSASARRFPSTPATRGSRSWPLRPASESHLR